MVVDQTFLVLYIGFSTTFLQQIENKEIIPEKYCCLPSSKSSHIGQNDDAPWLKLNTELLMETQLWIGKHCLFLCGPNHDTNKQPTNQKSGKYTREKGYVGELNGEY